MRLEIELDPQDDAVAVATLSRFCQRQGAQLMMEPIIVLQEPTALVTLSIEFEGRFTESMPTYPQYKQLKLAPSLADQSALIAFLGTFYSIGVVIDKSGRFFFNDEITPFYLRSDVAELYLSTFNLLRGQKLVTTDPLILPILKVYPNNAISRLKDHTIWYADPRADIKMVSKELLKLQSQHYFFPAASDRAARDVKEAYGFLPLGENCTCLGEHYIEPGCTKVYADLLPKEMVKPLSGPLGLGFNVEFFNYCHDLILSGVIPEVGIDIGYSGDRTTRVAALSAYLHNLEPSLPVDEEAMSRIGIYQTQLRAKFGSISAVKAILNEVKTSQLRVTIVPVSSKEIGLLTRIKYIKYLSVLLQDNEGWYVGLWDYDSPVSPNNLIIGAKPSIYEAMGFRDWRLPEGVNVPGLILISNSIVKYPVPVRRRAIINDSEVKLPISATVTLVITLPTGLARAEVQAYIDATLAFYIREGQYTEWALNYLTLGHSDRFQETSTN
jgi:hypothetical protein